MLVSQLSNYFLDLKNYCLCFKMVHFPKQLINFFYQSFKAESLYFNYIKMQNNNNCVTVQILLKLTVHVISLHLRTIIVMTLTSDKCWCINLCSQIQSRGQLVKYGRYKTKGQLLISLIIPITKSMLPSFRIIAYYHTNDNEVVSDSVWVDAKDSCMGSVRYTTRM